MVEEQHEYQTRNWLNIKYKATHGQCWTNTRRQARYTQEHWLMPSNHTLGTQLKSHSSNSHWSCLFSAYIQFYLVLGGVLNGEWSFPPAVAIAIGLELACDLRIHRELFINLSWSHCHHHLCIMYIWIQFIPIYKQVQIKCFIVLFGVVYLNDLSIYNVQVLLKLLGIFWQQ